MSPRRQRGAPRTAHEEQRRWTSSSNLYTSDCKLIPARGQREDAPPHDKVFQCRSFFFPSLPLLRLFLELIWIELMIFSLQKYLEVPWNFLTYNFKKSSSERKRNRNKTRANTRKKENKHTTMGRENKREMAGTLKHCIIWQTAQFAYLTAQTWFTSFPSRLLFCLRIGFNNPNSVPGRPKWICAT